MVQWPNPLLQSNGAPWPWGVAEALRMGLRVRMGRLRVDDDGLRWKVVVEPDHIFGAEKVLISGADADEVALLLAQSWDSALASGGRPLVPHIIGEELAS